jgi:ribosomal protein S1
VPVVTSQQDALPQEGVEVESETSSALRRPLSDFAAGEQVQGVVTRIELFGAFVDFGAEQEGLIHISRLQSGHVNRVEDVVQVGQSVTSWIHRIDVASGRVELTMLRPVLLKWKDVVPGLRTKGKVVRVERFGAFIDIGAERPGLVHVSEMSGEYVTNPLDVVKPEDEVPVVVLDVDRKKRQIRLSMKEAAVAPEEPAEEEAVEHIPTAMEHAIRQAMNQADQKPTVAARSASGQPVRNRKDQDELLSRTLRQRVKTGSSQD